MTDATLPDATLTATAAPMPEIAAPAMSVEAFTFGEPESVLERNEVLAMLQVMPNGKWYEPPIEMRGLARTRHMSPHHSSAIILKRNMLMMSFIPNRLLSRSEFGAFTTDFLALGNAYLERVDNLANRPLVLRRAPAIGTRVGVAPGDYYFIPAWQQEHAFRTGSIFHLKEPDLGQEIYGVPDWYAALQAGLLNEAATLFRRKYYKNGSHAGYILYISEEHMSDKDSGAVREALRQAKGPGNFRNLFLHIPKGKKDGVQVIPVSQFAANDEFIGIKNASRDDMLAAHRMPPQLLGVVPTNSGGFGSITDAAKVFFAHEIVPLQARMREINDWLGLTAIDFAPYAPPV